jgi:tetrahydromethanopterin S-methyltransferase subunit G
MNNETNNHKEVVNKVNKKKDIHDDKYNFGLLATMIVIGMAVNHWFGLEKGIVYGSVMVGCILVWFVVAVIDYFQRINKNNDDN